MTTTTDIQQALQDTSFENAKIKLGQPHWWHGTLTAEVRWSWANEDRAALVSWLKLSGIECTDRVEHISIPLTPTVKVAS